MKRAGSWPEYGSTSCRWLKVVPAHQHRCGLFCAFGKFAVQSSSSIIPSSHVELRYSTGESQCWHLRHETLLSLSSDVGKHAIPLNYSSVEAPKTVHDNNSICTTAADNPSSVFRDITHIKPHTGATSLPCAPFEQLLAPQNEPCNPQVWYNLQSWF